MFERIVEVLRGAGAPVVACLGLAVAWGSPVAAAEPEAAPAAAQQPSSESVEALVFDVERIVGAEEGSGWLIDSSAYESIHAVMMESVCRAAPAVRSEALRRLADASRRAGEPQQLFELDGRRLTDRVERALSSRRRLTALERAVGAAAQCPFWLPASQDFRGRQSMRRRVIVTFDTGGTVQLRRTVGHWSLGAGGFGRLLAGYGFTSFSLLAGLEFGGGALLEPNTDPTEFVINYLPALPVIARFHEGPWNLDLEAAAVALFQVGNKALSHGVRGGVTVGYSSLRLRGILPWVGLAVASEYHFENSARPSAVYLRGGLRVGGVWDP